MSPIRRPAVLLAMGILACWAGTASPAPSPPREEPAQDSTLNHLVHAAGYVTADSGSLGKVVERGTGPVDMVLVSGFGLGASAFEGFMRRNASRYHMLAVTLPGFEGTAAPPMPPPGTSYGEQSWTRAAVAAVAKLIEDRHLDHPVLVGHFLNGTQVAMRVATEHPERVRAVVLLAGSPRFEPVTAWRSWPKRLTVEQKVAAVDRFLAPGWFKMVTRATWVKSNFVAGDYSVMDSTRGRRFADLANAPPMPVLVRWLCEFHASDLWDAVQQSRVPVLLLQPSFTAALRADPSRNTYLESFFEEPWRGHFQDGPDRESAFLTNAGIMVMEDQPVHVDGRIAEFLGRHPAR